VPTRAQGVEPGGLRPGKQVLDLAQVALGHALTDSDGLLQALHVHDWDRTQLRTQQEVGGILAQAPGGQFRAQQRDGLVDGQGRPAATG